MSKVDRKNIAELIKVAEMQEDRLNAQSERIDAQEDRIAEMQAHLDEVSALARQCARALEKPKQPSADLPYLVGAQVSFEAPDGRALFGDVVGFNGSSYSIREVGTNDIYSRSGDRVRPFLRLTSPTESEEIAAQVPERRHFKEGDKVQFVRTYRRKLAIGSGGADGQEMTVAGYDPSGKRVAYWVVDKWDELNVGYAGEDALELAP